MNLIGPGPSAFHFDDCSRGLEGLLLRGHWADLGSGAGFPGLVMADIFPELQVDLIESRQKRATFLRHVLMNAPTPIDRVRVVEQRVERLVGERFDGVTSRAFAPPLVMLEHARRLTKPGGQTVLFLQEAPDSSSFDGWEHKHTNVYRVQGRERATVWLARQR